MPDELAAGHVPRPEAQLLQFLQKVPALPVPLLGGADHSGVEVPAFAPRPEEGQLVPVKAVQRGAQGGDEGHVLAGVVHDLQQGQGHIHLSGLKEVPAAVRPPRDPRLGQLPQVVVHHHPGAAQEDHHVGGAQGPLPVPLLHHQGLIQQRPDAPGGPPGLQAVLVLPLPLLLVSQEGQVQQVQLQLLVFTLRELALGD